MEKITAKEFIDQNKDLIYINHKGFYVFTDDALSAFIEKYTAIKSQSDNRELVDKVEKGIKAINKVINSLPDECFEELKLLIKTSQDLSKLIQKHQS